MHVFTKMYTSIVSQNKIKCIKSSEKFNFINSEVLKLSAVYWGCKKDASDN